MATYYRWRKSEAKLVAGSLTPASGGAYSNGQGNKIYYSSTLPPIVGNNYSFSLSTNIINNLDVVGTGWSQYYFAFQQVTNIIYTNADTITYDGSALRITGTNLKYRMLDWGPGALVSYVYSISPSAYPNGAQIDGYYYDQRTTITSPAAPTGLTYPSPITTPSVSVSWTAAVSNVPSYAVNLYEVSYSTNGGTSWTVAGTTDQTSYAFSVSAGTTSIMFRVRARDSNNQWGNYVTGTASQVLLAPTLTVPQMVMQGQSATVSWTAVEGADSYTLQRKSSADTDWTQVYSGTALTFSETVGTWTSLQYRVQAVFDETPGGWATSGEIQIVSASALVISGQDGALGTLTNDVQYVVSSSGSGAIAVTESIGGQEVRTFTAENGGTNKISVLDLPTGSGVTIKITASTNPGSGTVSVTRTWTYSKESPIFSDSGGTAQLQWQGQDIWPLSLAECVRTPDFWGGNLMLALQKLTDVVLYKGGNNFSDIFNKSIPLVTSSQISSYGKIQTGTYTGTGAYGSTNPTSLTFNFTPKLVLIFDTTGLFSQPQNGQTYYVSYGMILWAPGISKDIVSSYPDKYRYYTLTGNKFSWYADGPNANYQLNDKKTYRWVAFG